MTLTAGHFDDWLEQIELLKLGLVSPPDSSKFRLILHQSTLIGSASSKAEVLASELVSGNGYSRYAYTITRDEVSFDPVARATVMPARQWEIMATGAALQWAGVVMLADAADQAPVVCTANPSSDRISRAGHGLTDGDEVLLGSEESVFGGLSPATIYFVTNATTDDFQVEVTIGGGALPISDAGNGDVYLHYASGMLVAGATHSQLQTLPDGKTQTFEWLPLGTMNTTAGTGNSWA